MRRPRVHPPPLTNIAATATARYPHLIKMGRNSVQTKSTQSGWRDAINILSFAIAVAGVVQWVLTTTPPPGPIPVTGSDRVLELVGLGLVSAFIQLGLWSGAEKIFGWDFGAGGGNSLPAGWQAAILSLTLTVPLTFLPPQYQWLTGHQMVSSTHYTACMAVISASIIGHILLYGTRLRFLRFPGLKNLVYPLGAPLNFWRAICMEGLFAIVHFTSIALVYRYFVYAAPWPPPLASFKTTILAALIFLGWASVFIAIRYPESLTDKTWIQVRGALNGTVLAVALIWGMLM